MTCTACKSAHANPNTAEQTSGPVYIEVNAGNVTAQPAKQWEHAQHIRNLEDYSRRGDKPGYEAYLRNAGRSLTSQEMHNLLQAMKERSR